MGARALSLAALAGCATREPPCVAPALSGDLTADNVVVVVMDDVGVDKVGAWGLHPRPAPTPHLDALAGQGALFRSAYAEPVCSSSRAALLTGRRPVRTGIGNTVSPHGETLGLPEEEVLIPEILRDRGWTSAAVGKWHLALFDDEAPEAPRRQGFDHFDGLLGNPESAWRPGDGPYGYSRWERVTDGAVRTSEVFLTEAQGDAAVDGIATLPEPFFLYVAFSAAHVPLEVPPEGFFSEARPTDAAGIGDAMIEAMDREIGRIADALGDRGVLIVTADNGTSSLLMRPPSDPARDKATVYAGGARVPLVVRGPGVVPGIRDGLVHVADLFHTVLDLAGVDGRALPRVTDGTSLVPALLGGPTGRRCLFVEQFAPNGAPARHPDTAVVEDRFVLVAHPGASEELYRRDPAALDDGEDLLLGPLDVEAREAHRRLRQRLHEGE